MIDKIEEWIWNIQSIDQFWDDVLKSKSLEDCKSIITNLPEGHLQEYLTLKMRYGIGKAIIMVCPNKNGRFITCDIRDFEAYIRCIQKYKSE